MGNCIICGTYVPEGREVCKCCETEILEEEVIKSYYGSAGNYCWVGSRTGVHIIRNK